MKKILFVLAFAATVLAACHTSTLSMSEIDKVPNPVQDKIDSNDTLQLILDGEDIAYIVYQSNGTVAADLEPQNDKLKAMVTVKDEKDDRMEQKVSTGLLIASILPFGYQKIFDLILY